MIDSATRSCGAVSTSSQVSSQKRPTSQSCEIGPTPHDSWVVGNETYVSLHFLGAADYAK